MKLLPFFLFNALSCVGQGTSDPCRVLDEHLSDLYANQGPSNPAKQADSKVIESVLGLSSRGESNRLGGLTLFFSPPGCVGQAVLDSKGLLFTTRFETLTGRTGSAASQTREQLESVNRRIESLQRELSAMMSMQAVLLRQLGNGPDRSDAATSVSIPTPLEGPSIPASPSPDPKATFVDPTSGSRISPGTEVNVRGYRRKDGSYVPPHTRSRRRK